MSDMSSIPDSYKTLKEPAEGTCREKGSKFLAYGFRVGSEEEVKEIIGNLKKQYHDARHHCYAYRIGLSDSALVRMNDDGEPSGTAGRPIMGQILSAGLTNILVVVVRYFGGTLLGTSGLIKAYKMATADCLRNASIVHEHITEVLTIRFPYEHLNSVMRIVNEESLRIDSQDSDVDCRMQFLLPASRRAELIAKFKCLEKLEVLA